MKIYELLIEAAYDSMITAIKTQLPDQIQYIDQNTQWAKQYLKKTRSDCLVFENLKGISFRATNSTNFRYL